MIAAQHHDQFNRAFVQSAFGHVAILVAAIVAMFASQFFIRVEPVEAPIEVAILAGPAAAGEFGAPPLDTAAKENTPPQNNVPPPPPPPPEQPKIEEPVIKEPPPVKIEEAQKPPEPVKKPDAEKPPDKPAAQTEPVKPKQHVVQVNTSKIVVVQNKPQPNTPITANNSRKNQQSQLTEAQIKALIAAGLPVSKGGGAGFGGGAPGSIARGTPSGAMDMYKAALKARLFNAWARPAGVEGLLTVIRVSIARDGVFISATFKRRSGNDQMDSSAMQAIRSVNPTPLPADADAPFQLDVEFDASGVSV